MLKRNRSHHPLYRAALIKGLLLMCMGTCISTYGQKNAAARYEIDAKRIGVRPGDKDALPRSREFLRLDSTYYVGWQYEGLYKYYHSADYLGYHNAVAPLEKALDLLERDYGNVLMHIYSSIDYFKQQVRFFGDFHDLAFALQNCYNTLEMPDKTMALLSRIEAYHFQEDYVGINNDRAWTYHRHRFFTSEKYAFLKNSIAENEAMAFWCCYTQIAQIKKNQAVNDYWYGPAQSENDLLSVYHNLAILHDYNHHYDSCEYYYNLLIEGERVVWGNYANFKHEIAHFDEAIFYYQKPEPNLSAQSLSEAHYYLPILHLYGARTKEAIRVVQQKIDESGSTPGFGWYTISLARSYLYDGQLDSCAFFLNKASNFKELHIGTTLTQPQYEFTINLLRVQLLDKQLALVKFFNKGWWYSFSDLLTLLELKLEKLMLEHVVAGALAQNPERNRLVYDLFCGETTVSYDETFYLLKDFSLPYFKRKYELYHLKDKRDRVQRYFDLFATKFMYEDGEEEKAVNECHRLLAQYVQKGGSEPEDGYEPGNEKLFEARLYELLSNYYEGEANGLIVQDKFYNTFPQLVPFSGLRMKLKLTFEGDKDAVIGQVIDEINSCNLDLNDPAALNVPRATIRFSKKAKVYQAIVNVTNEKGGTVVANEQLIFGSPAGVGKELALRLFAKGGAGRFEGSSTGLATAGSSSHRPSSKDRP